jgi:hypothetical protein
MKKRLGFALGLALSLLSMVPAVSSADPKDCPVDPDCSQYDSGGCIYTWYPDSSCCVAPPIEVPPYQIQCPTVCF